MVFSGRLFGAYYDQIGAQRTRRTRIPRSWIGSWSVCAFQAHVRGRIHGHTGRPSRHRFEHEARGQLETWQDSYRTKVN